LENLLGTTYKHITTYVETLKVLSSVSGAYS
jgi:hypothetical protein